MAKIPTPNSQLLCAQCGANTSLNAKLPKILESSNLILGKLRADYIPSSSEAKNIRDHVADIQTEVSQRDMEILHLRDALTQLVMHGMCFACVPKRHRPSLPQSGGFPQSLYHE